MKSRIVFALAALFLSAGCAQYKTCATYAKKTSPSHETAKLDCKSV